VRKGLTEAVGRDVYLLRPAFRVLTDYGSVSGTISADTMLSQDANCYRDGVNPAMGKVVYIFDGHVAPGDIGADGQELVTTVGDTDTDEKSEDLAFLSPIAEEFTDGFVTVTAGISLENVDF
jgi:hypothetical protein